jgi:hypothetical protein
MIIQDSIVRTVKAAADDLSYTVVRLQQAGMVKSASTHPDAIMWGMQKAAAEAGIDLYDLLDKQADFSLVAEWMIDRELAKAAHQLDPQLLHVYEIEKAAFGSVVRGVKNVSGALTEKVKDVADKIRTGVRDYRISRAIGSNVGPATIDQVSHAARRNPAFAADVATTAKADATTARAARVSQQSRESYVAARGDGNAVRTDSAARAADRARAEELAVRQHQAEWPGRRYNEPRADVSPRTAPPAAQPPQGSATTRVDGQTNTFNLQTTQPRRATPAATPATTGQAALQRAANAVPTSGASGRGAIPLPPPPEHGLVPAPSRAVQGGQRPTAQTAAPGAQGAQQPTGMSPYVHNAEYMGQEAGRIPSMGDAARNRVIDVTAEKVGPKPIGAPAAQGPAPQAPPTTPAPPKMTDAERAAARARGEKADKEAEKLRQTASAQRDEAAPAVAEKPTDWGRIGRYSAIGAAGAGSAALGYGLASGGDRQKAAYLTGVEFAQAMLEHEKEAALMDYVHKGLAAVDKGVRRAGQYVGDRVDKGVRRAGQYVSDRKAAQEAARLAEEAAAQERRNMVYAGAGVLGLGAAGAGVGLMNRNKEAADLFATLEWLAEETRKEAAAHALLAGGKTVVKNTTKTPLKPGQSVTKNQPWYEDKINTGLSHGGKDIQISKGRAVGYGAAALGTAAAGGVAANAFNGK